MTKHRTITSLLALVCLVSCTKISPQAITLTSTVDLAITRLQTQTESLIDAAVAQHLACLDDAWPSIYTNADAGFRASNSLSLEAPLTLDHRVAIGAIAAEAHDAIRLRIESKRQQLVADAQHNTDLVLSINASVRNHLLSITTLTQSQQRATDALESITDIPLRQHWEQLTSILIPTASPTETSQ